jgi:hypothetical protein
LLLKTRVDQRDNPAVASDLHERIASRLRSLRTGDGFGPAAGSSPEPEPTALATIALDDQAGRRWLADHQSADGGFGIRAGTVVNDSATGLAALALQPGDARERALDNLVSTPATRLPFNPDAPHDPTTRGWAWTAGTFGWVEPTARAVLALRLLRPGATAPIADGVAMLEDRQCDDGGWNYGNAVVLGDRLPSYGQTTAVALLALQGDPRMATDRGVGALRTRSREERGGLTLATSLAALRLLDTASAVAVESALEVEFERSWLMDDVVVLSWAAIATGPGIEWLRWSP